jgi:mannose-6-phosphate isomerase-like protein (cupin superfamily)
MRKIVAALVLFLGTSVSVAEAQPPTPRVVLDNPSVLVTVTTLPPGTGTGRHQGIEPEVSILVEGEVTVESPLGRVSLKPGGAYWLPGLTPHDTRNEGSRPARFFEIFLKRCD